MLIALSCICANKRAEVLVKVLSLLEVLSLVEVLSWVGGIELDGGIELIGVIELALQYAGVGSAGSLYVVVFGRSRCLLITRTCFSLW